MSDATEIVSRRWFRIAPQEIWEAFVDPVRLARWWGPKGFTNTFQAFDPRPQGSWRFVMHGPNGVDYPNESVFVEVRKAERLVIDHLSLPHFRLDVSLLAQDGGTGLTWRMSFETAQIRDQLKAIVVPANEENFDRLATVCGAT